MFKRDPWFIVGGNEVLDMGFGEPPREFFVKKLIEGVVVPGLVNAHTHLELSFLKDTLSGGKGVSGMATEIGSHRKDVSRREMREAAIGELERAIKKGTYFYNDIGNDAEFSDFLRSAGFFHGNRFHEILGFSNPFDQRRISTAREAMKKDHMLLPTPHSIYGSSPAVLRYIRENARYNSMSIHLFEHPEEEALMEGRGSLKKFLEDIGQYKEHSEMMNTSVLSYLDRTGMLSYKKLFLVHLLHAGNEQLTYLNEKVPHSAWVLCHRSNEFLGYERKNWELILNSPMTMLIGTDSIATTPDVCVMSELKALNDTGRIPESRLLKAATFNAYEYLEIHPSRIPYFLFPEAEPSIDSLSQVEQAYILRG